MKLALKYTIIEITKYTQTESLNIKKSISLLLTDFYHVLFGQILCHYILVD